MGHRRASDMESRSYDDEFLMEDLSYIFGVATGLFLGISFSIGINLLWHWVRDKERRKLHEKSLGL